jgi:3-oxoacyl-[acyl-carrier protein] reductase
MNLGLDGKVALVTGGSHGIGRSIALTLAREGCRVALCARGKERVDDVVGEIEAGGGEAIGVEADVMHADDVDRVVAAVIAAWGTLHILVNNAGGGGRWGSERVEETREDVWLDVYNKNAVAAMRFTMRALPHMRRQRWGRVVTITSMHGREGGGRPWFNMAKTAQTALMKNLALRRDLARDGITFNSVAPGAIMIPDTGWEAERDKDPAAFAAMVDREFPLGRLGTPDEVAYVVAMVCAAPASLVNGAAIAVDGGETRSF